MTLSWHRRRRRRDKTLNGEVALERFVGLSFRSRL